MRALDIETIPNRSLVDCLPVPEVKLGNLKDPAKIDDKKREAIEEQIASMALNPFFGRICSFATWGEQPCDREYNVIDEISDAAEIDLIQKMMPLFCATSTTKPEIITWNGHSFDLPFIFKRMILLKMDIPPNFMGMGFFCKKFSSTPHCDLMRELTMWDSQQRLKLDVAANLILGEKKIEQDVTKFIEMIESGRQSEIGVYNLKDAELTYRIYTRCLPYLF